MEFQIRPNGTVSLRVRSSVEVRIFFNPELSEFHFLRLKLKLHEANACGVLPGLWEGLVYVELRLSGEIHKCYPMDELQLVAVQIPLKPSYYDSNNHRVKSHAQDPASQYRQHHC